MSDITIYYNPFCVVSRNALTLIRHAGIEPTVIDYLRNRLSREKLLETYLTLDATLTSFAAGDYKLQYIVHDRAGGKDATFEVPITLTAADASAESSAAQ